MSALVLCLLGILLYFADWSMWLVLAPLFAFLAWGAAHDGHTDPSHEIGQD